MSQLIEGFDNDVVFMALFFTLLLAAIIPLYVMRPAQHFIETPAPQNAQRTDGLVRSVPPDIPPEPPNIPPNTGTNFTAQTSETESNVGASTTDDVITIKLILNETSHYLNVSKDMKLLDLKKRAFPVEMEAGKSVRLIFSGRVLNGDTFPLRYLGIMQGSVLHCVIADTRAQENATNNDNPTLPVDLDMSNLFLPLVSLMFALAWFTVVMYAHLFSYTSICFLVLLSFAFALLIGSSLEIF